MRYRNALIALVTASVAGYQDTSRALAAAAQLTHAASQPAGRAIGQRAVEMPGRGATPPARLHAGGCYAALSVSGAATTGESEPAADQAGPPIIA